MLDPKTEISGGTMTCKGGEVCVCVCVGSSVSVSLE